MTITKKGTVIELDIHGMYADDAKREIERYLSTVSPKVQEAVSYTHLDVYKRQLHTLCQYIWNRCVIR